MILLLLSSWKSSFSQDTTVRISKPVAIFTAQELIRLDEARIRIVLLESNIKNYQSVIESQSKIISSCEREVNNLKEIGKNKDALYSQLQTDYRALEKKYKGSVRLGRFYLVVAAGAVGFGVWQMLK